MDEENIKFNDFKDSKFKKEWTLNLIVCCVAIATGSFQFGYNIGSLNPTPTEFLKGFIKNHTFLFKEFHDKSALFKINEAYIRGNASLLENKSYEFELAKQEYFDSLFSIDLEYSEMIRKRKEENEKKVHELCKCNMTIEEYLNFQKAKLTNSTDRLESYRPKLAEGQKKVNKFTQLIWTIINCSFVIGGMVGTFISKLILDRLGRKMSVLVHHVVSIIGAVLLLISFFANSPVNLLLSRFLFGVQGGMACTIVPTYLSEISPTTLRGQTGVIHQLLITIGILFAQYFGLRQIFGNINFWGLLLALPFVPAILGIILVILFVPESPSVLIRKNDEKATRHVLFILRNTSQIEEEMRGLDSETEGISKEENISIIGLFKNRDYRWPLITSLTLHIVQQFSGINTIFYYSSDIFKQARIAADHIQYAILVTGIVNVLTTIFCIPLIDRVGRRSLLIYPMILIIFDFICLTLCISFMRFSQIFSFLSIFYICFFVICFAIGLGPIPFLYTAECFRQNARSSAMALSTFVNMTAGLLLTFAFPYVHMLINEFVFLIFAGFVGLAMLILWLKMPETKGKTVEDIIKKFESGNSSSL